MSHAEKKSVTGSLLGCGGTVLLVLAAYALYLGFLSPMNRGRGLGGGAAFLALLFGAPGTYLLYKARQKGGKDRDDDAGEGSH